MPDMKFCVTFMTCAEVEQSEKLPEPASQLVPWLMLLHNRHGRVPLVMHCDVSKCSTSSIQKAYVYDGLYLHCKLLLRNAVQTEDRFGSARAVSEI